MSKETAALLRKGRERIAVPERWTKEVDARDADAEEVYPNSDLAVCWCAGGSIVTESGYDDNFLAAIGALLAAIDVPTKNNLVSTFNDAPTTTHADILALFDRAIAAEELAQ